MPAPVPVTIPVVLTLAIAALLVDHVPPAVASVRVILAPVHTAVGPLIAVIPDEEYTVMILVTVVSPHALLTT